MNLRRVFLAGVAAALACAGVSAQDSAPKSVAPREGGTLAGTVKIDGAVPKSKKIKMDADPKCAALHADPLLTEEVVADAAGNVKWAFVYVKKGPSAEKEHKAPSTPALIDQKGCRYEPHVIGVMVGQDILIRNSDDLGHNVHALPFANKEFNIAQSSKGAEDKRQFSTEEVMVKVKCDIHPWMSAWAGVLKHPFHSVTNEKGEYKISGLDPGKYTVEVWQERYKSVTQEIDVKAGDNKADFVLKDKKE